MSEYPIVETERLTLRRYSFGDIPDLQRLIGDRDIAATTTNIPHPYEDGMAEQWIQTTEDLFKRGDGIHFATTLRPQNLFIGGTGLIIDKQNDVAELGYWIGTPYWNQGYGTEAAQAALRYGLEVLGLNRIYARHFASNPASGHVMQKCGMKYEGRLRQAFKKWGKFEDWEVYSILKGEI